MGVAALNQRKAGGDEGGAGLKAWRGGAGSAV
jgi:hypothetical protein